MISDMDSFSDTFWEVTYRKNIAKMIGVCWRYTQDRQTAEDLAHDAFIIAIDKVAGFEHKGPFEAWLRRIVVNVALQYVRERKREEKLGQIALYPMIFDDIPEDSDRNGTSFFSEAELLEAIGALPEHHRLVFNLYVIDNLTHAEIAVKLGISEGTSKSHLARARKKVKEILSGKLKKDRKRAVLWLMFPFRNVDRLITDGLKNFSADHLDNMGNVLPSFKSAPLSNIAYLKAGILISTVIVPCVLIVISQINTHKNKGAVESVTFESPRLIPTNIPQKFSLPPAATISENSVIVEKTKNEEPMKNLKTLSALLVAGIALDTAGSPNRLPVQFKNREIAMLRTADSGPEAENNNAAFETGPELMHGTFYASKILWSDDQHKLLLFGNNVKVDLNNQKFTGNGKFSFLNDVQYLVVNGKPAKLNETIELEKKKYRLVQLNESDGEKKYGESGKRGVVEITLAE